MLAEEQKSSSIKLSIHVVERRLPANDALLHRQPSRTEKDGADSLFAQNVAPASFAERCPRLMILAVTAGIFLAVITAEVEYLQASGYYWQ